MTDYSERLNKANEQIRFTDIKGKQYAEVNQRVLAFWSLFPNGRIATRKVGDDGKRCDFECLVYRDAQDEHPAATGHAFENRQGNVNSTSYVENCETSAIGRALGILGIGATTAMASADEVLNALMQQEADAASKKAKSGASTSKGASEPTAANGSPQQQKTGRFEKLTALKKEAMELGITEEGMKGGLENVLKGKPLKEATDIEVRACEGVIRTLINDKQELLREKGAYDVSE